MRSRVVAELVALFAPPGCAGCQTPLDDAREALCAGCRRELPWLRGPRCGRCGLPAPCAPCPAAGAAYERSWAPVAYAGPARALVHALKFDGALALADLMAAQIAATAPPEMLGASAAEASAEGASHGRAAAQPALVPVPTHPRRARRRGFDQAERLAQALSRRTGLTLVASLRRRGGERAQTGAPRRRRTTREIAFEVVGAAPRRSLLVDDVHTTGATLDAAARALRVAGATQVSALTYARTPKP